MTLDIALMGAPEVIVDGRPLEVDTRKAIALLALLALDGGPQPRDRLVDLLWPDSTPDRARSSLRRTLSTLRSALGERWVSADRSVIDFDGSDGVAVDVARFEAIVDDDHGHGEGDPCERCATEMARAVAIHRGPFMDGFALRDAPDFEMWVLGHAQRLDRLVARAYTRLASARAADGDYDRAIEAIAARMEVEPLDEQAHRTLMLLHAWNGDRAAAVDAYRSLVDLFDRELGVPPLEETTELYGAILEEDLPRAPAAPRRMAAARAERVEVELPLVGRTEPLAAAVACLSEPGGVLIVEGGMGAGTTRFLSEVAFQLRAEGRTILLGRCGLGESQVPYAAVQEALQGLLSDPEREAAVLDLPVPVLAELSRLLPEVDPGDSAPVVGTKTRFLEALAQVVATAPSPVLLFDDVHRADEATLEFIAFMARRADRLGVAIGIGIDAGRVAAGSGAGSMASALAAEGVGLVMEPLTLADVAALADHAGADVDAAELHRHSGGVAFFVVESIRSALAGESHVPEQIRRIVAARLSEVPDTARQVLDAVVTLGAADTHAASAVSGRTMEETDEAFDALLGHGFVVEEPDAVRPANGHVMDVMVGRQSSARRRLLHRRAAEALRTTPDRQGRSVAIARHLQAAGEDAEAARWFEAAGDEDREMFAHADAIAHYEAALALGHDDRTALHERIGETALLDGRYGLALRSFEAAIAASDEAEPRLEHRIAEVHRRLRRWDLAVAHYEQAEELDPEPELMAMVAADRAVVEHNRGGDAGRLVQRALGLAAGARDDRSLARAHNAAALVSDGPEEREEHLRQALEHAEHPGDRLAVLNNLALTAMAAGDHGEAVALSREAIDLAAGLGDRHLTAALYNTLADALHRGDDQAGSMDALITAVRLFADIRADEGRWTPEAWLLSEW